MEGRGTSETVEEPVGEAQRSGLGTFRALRHPNFRLFFFGQMISLTGTWLQATALGWLVYQLTSSQFLLGAVAAAGSAPMVLFGVWGGALADRYPKRTILVATQTLMMLSAAVLGLLILRGNVQTWEILALSTVGGIAAAFDMPARQSFVIEMTGRDDLLNAISLNSSVFNGARLIGPALAGFLIAKAGFALCFLLNGASFLAMLAALLLMRLPPHPEPEEGAGGREHALGGVRYVLGNEAAFAVLALFAAVGIFGWSYSVLMPAYARDLLHLSAEGYGLLMAASGFGATVGGLALATFGHRWPPKVLSLAGVCGVCVMLLSLSVARGFAVAAACLWLSGFSMMFFFSTSNTMLQSIVPDAMRGRVMGVWALVFGMVVPVGSLLAGSLAHWAGVRVAIAVGAGACGVAAVVSAGHLRSERAGAGGGAS